MIKPRLRRQHYAILLLLTLIAWGLDNYAYFNHLYAGDGFNCFNWLKNFGKGWGLWEGPLYEFVLGNHAYLSALLLAPLVAFFDSPLFLNYVGFFAVVGSVFLLYEIVALNIRFPEHRHFPLYLAIAYFIHPLTLDAMYGFMWDLFQPETLLALGIMSLTFFYLKEKKKLFLLTLALIILLKEEYVPTAPLIVFWLAAASFILRGRVLWRVRDGFLVALVVALSSWASLAALSFYKKLGAYHHVIRNGSLAEVLSWEILTSGKAVKWDLFINFLFVCAAVLPVAGPLFRRRSLRIASFFLLSIFIFVYGRMLTDRLIYGPQMHHEFSPGLEWANWARAVVPPMLFLSTGIAFCAGAEVYRKASLFRTLCFSMLAILVVTNVYFLSIPAKIALGISPLGRVSEETKKSIDLVRQQLPPATQLEVIMIPSPGWENFFFDRSYFQYFESTFSGLTQAPYFKLWLSEVNYAVIPKDQYLGAAANLFREFDYVSDAGRFVFLKRSQSHPARPIPEWRFWGKHAAHAT